jgi:hypothetical protein
MKSDSDVYVLPELKVQVLERGVPARRHWTPCRIGVQVEFSTDMLESYCVASWEPVVFDALLVAAAAEFADRSLKRPALSWQRRFRLVVPVHEPDRWNEPRVIDALHEALNFLTGDRWQIEFIALFVAIAEPKQQHFNLPSTVEAIIPYSDGMDSRCVAGLVDRALGDRLIRVRLGSRIRDASELSKRRQPFTSVPYRVHSGQRESTARSRGFKFSLISGLAAYLTKAQRVLVPESGQGALGPALITVGQGYADYRSHPLFTRRMEKFLEELLGHKVTFDFSQLWQTKAETLREFAAMGKSGESWAQTWSCWQQTRQVSVNGKKRQCGICAACLLRRMSVHAAGLEEARETYVWENLGAASFESGAAASFLKKKKTKAMHEYAIAGALHLDHLAHLRHSPCNREMLDLFSFQLAESLRTDEAETRGKLDRLLTQHETEWKAFMCSLGDDSFLINWAAGVQE